MLALFKNTALKRCAAIFLTLPLVCPPVYAQGVQLPAPGTRLALSDTFAPPLLKGIKVYRNDPFRFDFILDKGDAPLTDEQVKVDSTRLIKYFLASLTVPEKDLWVNLSPYEQDRIVPEAFGQTEMGRDLLAQDYILKQITASVIYPDEKVGKEFWDKVYAEALKRYGTTDIPIDTFNKVWIVPVRAKVYEKPRPADNNRPEEAVAYVVEAHLRVMLESDYLAMKNNLPLTIATADPSPVWGGNGRGEDFSKSLIRDIILPILEKEVNQGQNFAKLRQVYNSLILAAWYKRKIMISIKGSPLGFYVGQNKVAGVNIDDPKESEKIWSRYVESFKKGTYNFIREEYNPVTQGTIPRKYFAGGFNLTETSFDNAQIDAVGLTTDNTMLVQAKLGNVTSADNAVSITFKHGVMANVLLSRSHVWDVFISMNQEKEIPIIDIEQNATDSNNLRSEILRQVTELMLSDNDFVGLNLVIHDAPKKWTHYLTIVDTISAIKKGPIFHRDFKDIKIAEQQFILYFIEDRKYKNIHFKLVSLGKNDGGDLRGHMKIVFQYLETLLQSNFPGWQIGGYPVSPKTVSFMEKFDSVVTSQQMLLNYLAQGYEGMWPENLSLKRIPSSIKAHQLADVDAGGIDFNSVEKVVQVDASDAEQFFHFDPMILEKYRDSAGVTPVIVGIHSLDNLSAFLGVQTPAVK